MYNHNITEYSMYVWHAMLQVEGGVGASGSCLHWTGSGGIAWDHHTVDISEVCMLAYDSCMIDQHTLYIGA